MTIYSTLDSKKNISEILADKRRALVRAGKIALAHLEPDQRRMKRYLTVISESVNSRLMDSLTYMIIEQHNDIFVPCTYDTLHFVINNHLEAVAKLQDEHLLEEYIKPKDPQDDSLVEEGS
jgi:hypothetical protein